MPQDGTTTNPQNDDQKRIWEELDAIKRRLSRIGDPEFPELVQTVSMPISSGSPVVTPPPADDTRSVIGSVLGWRVNPRDPQGFVAALTQAFPLTEVEGNQIARWNPRSYSVRALQAGMGSITGAQASIYERARVALNQILPLLDGLQPLSTVADPQDMEAIRAIIRPELIELVDELGAEGGPRVQRVDALFQLLAKYRYDRNRRIVVSDPETVQGQLGELRERFGLKSAKVNTLEEEQNLTNFYILVDYVNTLLLSWDGQRHFFDREGADVFFGTQMVLLSRTLAVVAETVQEVYFAMDSVFLGAAERQVLMLDSDPPLSVSELLSWVEEATTEGIALMQKGGKDGVVLAFAPLISKIYKLVKSSMVVNRQNFNRFPDSFRSARVRGAISALVSQLRDARALALQIRHTPVTFAAIFPPSAQVGDLVRVTINGENLQAGSSVRLTKGTPPEESRILDAGVSRVGEDSGTLVVLSEGSEEEMTGSARAASIRRRMRVRAAADTGAGADPLAPVADIEAFPVTYVNEREIYATFDLQPPAGTNESSFTGNWNLVITDPDDDFEYWKEDAFIVEEADNGGGTGPTTTPFTVAVRVPQETEQGRDATFLASIQGTDGTEQFSFSWTVDGVSSAVDDDVLVVSTQGAAVGARISAEVTVTRASDNSQQKASGFTTITAPAGGGGPILTQTPLAVRVENDDEVEQGVNARFDANVDGVDASDQLTFAWTVDAGRPLGGATDDETLFVDTTGVDEDVDITAHVQVTRQSDGATAEDAGTIHVIAAPATGVAPPQPIKDRPTKGRKSPAATKFDEYKHTTLLEEHRRLDRFAEELERTPGAEGHIFVYRGKWDLPGEGKAHALAIRGYLALRHFFDRDQGRIVTATGAQKEDRTVQLWLVPAGAAPPQPE